MDICAYRMTCSDSIPPHWFYGDCLRNIRRCIPWLPLAFQPPHSANRHDANRGGAGADRVDVTSDETIIPLPANRVLRFCGIACVLLIVLWVRSYWWHEDVMWSTASWRIVCLESQAGRFDFMLTNPRHESSL